MSYSFQIVGASKVEAIEKVAAEFDKVIASQSAHSVDRDAATAAAEAFVAMLKEPGEGESIMVMVSGSLGWDDVDTDRVFTASSVNINASLQRS